MRLISDYNIFEGGPLQFEGADDDGRAVITLPAWKFSSCLSASSENVRRTVSGLQTVECVKVSVSLASTQVLSTRILAMYFNNVVGFLKICKMPEAFKFGSQQFAEECPACPVPDSTVVADFADGADTWEEAQAPKYEKSEVSGQEPKEEFCLSRPNDAWGSWALDHGGGVGNESDGPSKDLRL